MVKNEIAAALAATLMLAAGCAPKYSWKCIPVDASLTGVTYATATTVASALGTVDSCGVYTAPCGSVFGAESVTAAQAAILLSLQPEMSDLKRAVAYVPETMRRKPACSGLRNMVADCLAEGAAKATGKKIDVAFANEGCIRVDFLQGYLLEEDLMAVLPFKNKIIVGPMKGSNLTKLFEQMAREGIQAFSGATVTVKDKSLVELAVGGKPVSPDRLYTVATVDFLLDGGDNFYFEDLYESYQTTDVLIAEPLRERVTALGKAGKPVSQKPDGRLTLL